MPRGTFRVLAALAELREAGIPVLMIAGNHDCWGGEILRDDVGVDFRIDPWEGLLAGWRSRVEHGDGLRDKADRGYPDSRRGVRDPLALRVVRLLPPHIGSARATRPSHTSRTFQARDGGAGLREAASQRLSSRSDLDLLIYGHTHVAELRRIARAVYANAGSWLVQPTFLRVTSQRIELRRWDGSDEGVNLDSLDRVAEKALT